MVLFTRLLPLQSRAWPAPGGAAHGGRSPRAATPMQADSELAGACGYVPRIAQAERRG